MTVALIAHDQKKDEMSAFVRAHAGLLHALPIVSTGTTGARILEACPDLSVTRMKSGPLGGDQQIGAMIAEGRIALVIFFIDPLTPLPHDVDVKALLRLAAVHDVPLALNRASADIMLPAFAAAQAPATGG